MFVPQSVSTNVLDGKILVVKMRVDGAWEQCTVTRVYYEDDKKLRNIFVDVLCHEKLLTHIPFSAIHRYSTSDVVAYMFQQEERDRMLLHDRLHCYVCHVSFRLQQGRLRGELVWHGVVVVSQRPTAGDTYMRGHVITTRPHIILRHHVPLLVSVRDYGKEMAAVRVMIDSMDDREARVTLKGDVNTIHTSILIDDLVYSGKDKFNTYLEVLDTW